MSPYSLNASTAYWLQVGMKRHVGNRRGEIMLRYSWMTKMTPRAALPAFTAGPRSWVCSA